MVQDEAGFGRINKPKYCWCRKGIRPRVAYHHIHSIKTQETRKASHHAGF
jgi:putative transposase